MRSAPGKIKNPRTPEQLTQRAKISLLGDLGRRFAPIIKEGFRERPKMNSVFNAFVSANVPFVTVDDEYRHPSISLKSFALTEDWIYLM